MVCVPFRDVTRQEASNERRGLRRNRTYKFLGKDFERGPPQTSQERDSFLRRIASPALNLPTLFRRFPSQYFLLLFLSPLISFIPLFLYSRRRFTRKKLEISTLFTDRCLPRRRTLLLPFLPTGPRRVVVVVVVSPDLPFSTIITFLEAIEVVPVSSRNHRSTVVNDGSTNEYEAYSRAYRTRPPSSIGSCPWLSTG